MASYDAVLTPSSTLEHSVTVPVDEIGAGEAAASESAAAQALSAADVKLEDIFSEDGATLIVALNTLHAVAQHCRGSLNGGAWLVKLNDTITLDARIMKRIVSLTSDESRKGLQIPTAALTLLGRISDRDDLCKQALVDAGILPILQETLEHFTSRERRSAALTVVAGLAYGNRKHVRGLVDHRIVPQLVEVVRANVVDPTRSVTLAERDLAMTSLLRLTECGSEGILLSLVDDLLAAVRAAIESDQSVLIHPALEVLNNILRMPVRDNPFEPEPTSIHIRVEEAGLLDALDRLQTHPDDTIYERVHGLLERCFCAVDGDDQADTGEDVNRQW